MDAGVSEDAAYEVCRILWENIEEAREMTAMYKQFKSENFAWMADLDVPYHPGALKYWKEKGFIK